MNKVVRSLVVLVISIGFYQNSLLAENKQTEDQNSWFSKTVKTIKKKVKGDSSKKTNIEEKTESDNFELVWADEDLSPEAKKYFIYLKSTYQHMSGKLMRSLQSFEKLFSGDVPNYAYEGFIRLLHDLNQFEKINNLSNNVKQSFENNLDIQLIFAESLLNSNKDEQAETLFKKLVKKYPENEKVAYYAAVSYIKGNKPDKALEFINQCLEKPVLRSRYFLFHFLASKIYLSKKDNKKAMKSIKKSLELYPEFEKGWLLKAMLEEQQGKISDAISGYKKFLDIVGEDIAIEKQLVHLLFSSGRFQEAANILQKMEIDTPEYYFDLALIEFKANNFKNALNNINNAIEKFPDFIKARLLKVEILISNHHQKEAVEFVQQWLEQNPSDRSVIRVLTMLRRGGVDTKIIIKTLENVLSKNNKNQEILSVLADLYLEEKDYNSVLNYCQKLLNETTNNQLKAKLIFQIAFIHFMKGDGDKLEQSLQQALKENAVYPSAYNLLAYYYAQNNKNLDEALRLIELAIKKEPKNYYYLDTKGYIFLRMSKAKEAVPLFQRALDLAGNDEVIQNHLDVARSLK